MVTTIVIINVIFSKENWIRNIFFQIIVYYNNFHPFKIKHESNFLMRR